MGRRDLSGVLTGGLRNVIKHSDLVQGSVQWFALRMGRVTASEVGNLLTPKFEPRTGDGVKTYLYSKLAEVWRGKPLIHSGSWATEQGQVRQDEAIPFLALEMNWDIRDGGFIETDDHKAGCSPDGLVESEINPFGVEVKCPEPVNHVRYLINGTLPSAYVTQVHASLYVTGFEKWVFMSYQRGFPPLILEIKRDEEIIAKIATAVDTFHDDLAKAKRVLERYAEEPIRQAAA